MPKTSKVADDISLRFSPKAYSKLFQARDKWDVEISGWGICEDPDDLLHVTDFITVPQECTSTSTEMDDDGVADFFDAMLERGLTHEQFSRIWIHTHPGSCSNPSQMDEETFEEQFANSNWAVMVILSKSGSWYCRYKMNKGPVDAIELPVRWYPSHRTGWLPDEEDQFHEKLESDVRRKTYNLTKVSSRRTCGQYGDYDYSSRGGLWYDQDEDDWKSDSKTLVFPNAAPLAETGEYITWESDSHRMHGGTADGPWFVTLSDDGSLVKVHLDARGDFDPEFAELVDEGSDEEEQFWADFYSADPEGCYEAWGEYYDTDPDETMANLNATVKELVHDDDIDPTG